MNTEEAVKQILDAVRRYAEAVGAIYETEGFAMVAFEEAVRQALREQAPER
jgi:hypothetical protein